MIIRANVTTYSFAVNSCDKPHRQKRYLLLDFDLTRKATDFSYSIFLLACEGYGASVARSVCVCHF